MITRSNGGDPLSVCLCRCLVTRLFAFTFTRSREDPRAIEPVYVGELLPTPKLPADAFIEV